MIDQASVPSLMGSTVRDSAGEKIGKVGQVYLDDTTGQPEWVTVRTGLVRHQGELRAAGRGQGRG
jgi:sporulation protein YlmC with PRC-barrel domain